MAEYRRMYLPGSTVFLTLVTYNRTPLFLNPENVSRLRLAIAAVRAKRPFEITAAVVLLEHIHFLWTLPPNDSDYSKRIARLKIIFTQSLRGVRSLPQNISNSRHKHRESDVGHRRFWEHTIRDDQDFEQHLNYIHYNPVKHGLVLCPHLWPYSSFTLWVRKGIYQNDWCCSCYDSEPKIPNFSAISKQIGE